MGSRARLGVVLDGEDGKFAVGEAFHRSVVDVDVADGEAAGGRDGGCVDLEAVVLGGDVDASGGDVADGMVGAAVPEAEAGGLGADGQSHHLVAEADGGEGHAPPRDRAVQEGAKRLDGGGEGTGAWVARAIADDDAGRLEGEDFLGTGVIRNDHGIQAPACQ